ncbi:hypothetical protein [Vibrio splendidus]|uniref:hypothetical protein n=1 Tax=Vibrio splendidus TaxID=29497 RepID=UPI0003649812|nr:hypothetical protein [Vibrio splendidus]OEF21989.1 type II restriction endonuclease [Vibrio splendidus 5S-101]PTP81062.1 type II restriction endonuclease [Vibrio splendidus]
MSVRPINFSRSCIKTLSAVEAERPRSNQHEFNGVTQLRNLFGPDRISVDASFSVRGRPEVYQAGLTWYDARERHPTRSEYRLYFQSSPVMDLAREGDNIVIGFDLNGDVHCELITVGTLGHRVTDGWIEM